MSRSRDARLALDVPDEATTTGWTGAWAPRGRRAAWRVASSLAQRGCGARVLPAARALGAGRGRARRRPGAREAALRRAAERAETALAGLEEPLGRYLLELEPDVAEGRSWYGEPGAGEVLEWEPGAERGRASRSRRTGSRRPTSSSRCSSGRCRASTTRPDRRPSPDRSSLWAGLFDLRENLSSGGGRRPARACRLSSPSSARSTSISSRAATALPRPGETVTRRDASSATRRQGREPGGRRGPARRATSASSAASVTTPFAGEALAGLRRGGRRSSTSGDVDAPTGVALIHVDGAGENDDRRRAGRQRAARARTRRPDGRRGPVPARDPARPPSPRRRERAGLLRLNAAPGAAGAAAS